MLNDRGEMDRPLPLYEIDRIPLELWLEGDGEDAELKWNRFPGKDSELSKEGLLEDFIKLVDASPDVILKFAQQRGVIDYCAEHRGAVGYHEPGPGSYCEHLFSLRRERSAPLRVWRALSRRFRALLTIASKLHQGTLPTMEDWLAYDPHGVEGGIGYVAGSMPGLGYLEGDPMRGTPWIRGSPQWPATIEGDKSKMANEIGYLGHYMGRVTIDFVWLSQHPNIFLRGFGLVGDLTIQLTFAVAATSGVVICTSCGAPYLPERKPASRRRNYCSQCRESGAAHRDAARDHWRRRNSTERSDQ